MTYFFASKFSSKEKWKLVEEYFLGTDLTEQINKFLDE